MRMIPGGGIVVVVMRAARADRTNRTVNTAQRREPNPTDWAAWTAPDFCIRSGKIQNSATPTMMPALITLNLLLKVRNLIAHIPTAVPMTSMPKTTNRIEFKVKSFHLN